MTTWVELGKVEVSVTIEEVSPVEEAVLDSLVELLDNSSVVATVELDKS